MSNTILKDQITEEIPKIYKGPKEPLEEVFKDEDAQDLTRTEKSRIWKKFANEQSEGFFKLKDFLSPDNVSEFNLMLL